MEKPADICSYLIRAGAQTGLPIGARDQQMDFAMTGNAPMKESTKSGYQRYRREH
jgi:hypothetical protein